MLSFTGAFLLLAREGGGGKDFEHPVYDDMNRYVKSKYTWTSRFDGDKGHKYSYLSPFTDQC